MGAAGREVVADDGAWATGELGNAIGRWPLPSAESSPGADEVGLWCSAPCSVRGRCCNWSVPLAGGVACPTRAFLNMMNAPRGPTGRPASIRRTLNEAPVQLGTAPRVGAFHCNVGRRMSLYGSLIAYRYNHVVQIHAAPL